MAYGSSQARGWIRAIVTHTTAHSNAGSLTYTEQVRDQTRNLSRLLVGFVSAAPRWKLLFFFFFSLFLFFFSQRELLKTGSWRDTCTAMFIAALFTAAETGKQPKCPSTSECIKEMQFIHAMGYLFNLITCHNTDEPRGHYAKWNKPISKGNYCIIPFSKYLQ